jgi:acyl-CoA thioester hydrolase
VASRLVEVRSSACVIQQRVMRDDQLVVDATITVAWVGPDGRPRRQPRDWTSAFAALQGD